MAKKKQSYIDTLFDNINGGDCVDSADIAHELCMDMLSWLKAEYNRCAPLSSHGRELAALISKAEGRT